MRIPGPDHPITIESNPKRVVVRFAGRVIASTHQALTLREASYPPVQYIPRADVDVSLIKRTEHSSHCPYKGDASYFSIHVDGRDAANAIWSYEAPFAAVNAIQDHLAFYPYKVDAIEELDGR